MTELSALHVKITGDANGLKAAAGTALGAIERVGKSAEDSARVFERAFAQNEKSVEQLRRAIDPLYAASKRYETAVGTLDKALKLGTISQAQHTKLIDQAGAAYLRNGDQAAVAATRAGALGGAFGRLGSVSDQTRGRIQNVAFQLQDMAVQLQSGTRASVVFAQQGSQIAGAFGPVGAVIGVLAAVGIPALAMAFAAAGGKAQSFDDTLARVEESLSRLKEASAVYSAEGIQTLIDKYGELTKEVLGFIEAQRQQALGDAMRSATEAVSALRDEFGRDLAGIEQLTRAGSIAMDRMKVSTGLTKEQVRDLKKAFDELDAAQSLDGQVSALTKIRELLAQGSMKGGEFYKNILAAEDALRQMNAEGGKAGGWLGAAIGGASTLAGKMWEAAQAAAAVRGAGATDERGSQRGQENSAGAWRSQQANAAGIKGMNGGSGVGAGANPITAELESLQQSLMTQEEAQIASFERQQETLRAALDQRLITQQEYAAMMEDAQSQHSDRMSQIDAYRYGTTLQQTGAFFGQMASAFASGNEKMAAIGKKFAAVEALINAWRAYSQTLADPSLPFFAKFAAAASVLAAGMNAVSAIKGGGGGGKSSGGSGASGGSGSAANSPAAPSTYFNVQLTGGDNFGKGQVRDLITAINKEIESGAVIRGIRAT